MITSVLAAAVKVLFIGNSLTAANDLPAVLQQLASAANRPITCRAVAFGGYSLEDHWNRGDARRAIAEGGWSFVVLQQGPSALPESRVLLVEYAQKFADAARQVGAEPVLYMVWPELARRSDSDGVRLSYETAARKTRARLAPVGEAFRAALRTDGAIHLFGGDGFHPSPTGTFLAAAVLYRTIFATSPPDLAPPGVSDTDRRTIRAALDAIAKGYGS
jgi:hypothetical protein